MKLNTLLLITVSAIAGLALSSCNTFSGLGQDVQRVGQGLQNTASGQQF